MAYVDPRKAPNLDPMKWNAVQCYDFMRNRYFEEIPGLLEMAMYPDVLDRSRRRIRAYLESYYPHRLVRTTAD